MISWLKVAIETVQAAAFWQRFSEWRKKRQEEKAAADVAKVVLLALLLGTLASCRTAGEIREYCLTHPEDTFCCERLGICPRPTPTPEVTPSATATPGPTRTPTRTRTPTPTPGPTVAPSPTPTPTPFVTVPTMPVMTKFKIGGFGQDCKLGSVCCQNPEGGPLFQRAHLCEVGSTQTFDYADPAKWSLRHGGPCDPGHGITWANVCGMRDYDIVGGPSIELTSACPVSWEKSGSNPHHTLVTFTPGCCYEICAFAPADPLTADGVHVKVLDNNRTCATHCY